MENKQRSYVNAGIKYNVPEVFLLGSSDPMIAEFYGRTAYDSFDKSENPSVIALNNAIEYNSKPTIDHILSNNIKGVESELLKQLSHVHFHHSVIEHVTISFFIKGVSRALLQELARHRVMSLTVKSTRYTLSQIINAFIVAKNNGGYDQFYNLLKDENILTTANTEYNNVILRSMYYKLNYQYSKLGKEEFATYAMVKDMQDKWETYETPEELLEALESKTKRNVGDVFKHCIDENLSVDLGVTINLRSLKNMLDLRLNNSAWFQFQVLANEIFNIIPDNLKSLIDNPTNPKLANRAEKIQEMINKGEWK